MDVDEFAGRLSFFFGIGMNFYLEIAKLRAARLLWWRIMQAFAPKNPKSSMLRTHCQTSGWSLTEQDPYNNIVRTAIEAMAAVFGGTQSLHTNSFDEAMALPSDFAARIARNTQVILQEETHITQRDRPVGGLVHDGAADAGHGGPGVGDPRGSRGDGRHDQAPVESGWAKLKIEAAAAEKQARIDSGEDVIVGVNKFRLDRRGPDRRPRDRQHRGARCADSRGWRRSAARRDGKAVAAALAALTEAARSGKGNLLDLSIKAARCARHGRRDFGRRWRRCGAATARRRRACPACTGRCSRRTACGRSCKCDIEAFAAEEGRRPRLMVAKLGQDGHDRGAKVVATAFADLGFDVDIGPLFQTPEEAARQAIENDVHAVGVSTLAAGHKTLVPALIAALREQGAEDVIVFVGGVVPAAGLRVPACGRCRCGVRPRHGHPGGRAADHRCGPSGTHTAGGVRTDGTSHHDGR